MVGILDDCLFLLHQPQFLFFRCLLAIFVHKIDYLNLKFTASMNFYPLVCAISLPNFTDLIKISIFFMSQYFYKNNLQKYLKTVSYINVNNIRCDIFSRFYSIHDQLATNKITTRKFSWKKLL